MRSRKATLNSSFARSMAKSVNPPTMAAVLSRCSSPLSMRFPALRSSVATSEISGLS